MATEQEKNQATAEDPACVRDGCGHLASAHLAADEPRRGRRCTSPACECEDLVTPDDAGADAVPRGASRARGPVLDLTPAELATLTPRQVAALSAAELRGLSRDQVHALSPEQLAALSPDQLAVLSAEQTAVLSGGQTRLLDAEQLAALRK